jgi:hypothetical protein
MRFFEIVVSGAALISSAFAVTIDTYPTGGVEAGKSYTITYSPKDQPATFTLRKGLSTDLQTVGTIGTLFARHNRSVFANNYSQALALVALSPGLLPRTSPTLRTTLLWSPRAVRSTTLASSP